MDVHPTEADKLAAQWAEEIQPLHQWRPASIQAPEGSDLAAAAAAEQDANDRCDRAIEARQAAREDFQRAQAAYDAASDEQEAAGYAAIAARRAHIAAMRAAGVAQTADGYVPR